MKAVKINKSLSLYRKCVPKISGKCWNDTFSMFFHERTLLETITSNIYRQINEKYKYNRSNKN